MGVELHCTEVEFAYFTQRALVQFAELRFILMVLIFSHRTALLEESGQSLNNGDLAHLALAS